jgi:HAD superfamily hydrolase (TIGR01509 family)
MWSTTCSSFLIDSGITPEEDIDHIVIKMTNHEASEYVQEKYFPSISVDEMEKRLSEFVVKSYVKQKLKPNAISLLENMKKHGKVVLYSATSKPLLLASLNTLGIKDYFSKIYSGSELGLTKTDGSGFLAIKDLEGIKKEECLVVEDAIHAIFGAYSVGIDVLGVEDTMNQKYLHELYEKSNYFLPLK